MHQRVLCVGSVRVCLWAALLVLPYGCKAPDEHLKEADTSAYDIIQNKQQDALGRTEAFQIERPSEILRRRLIAIQALPVSGSASLGTDALEPVPYWPQTDYVRDVPSREPNVAVQPDQPLKLTLVEAMQIGAANSFEYQNRKEGIFSLALDLDLARDRFRNYYSSGADSQYINDRSSGSSSQEVNNNGSFSVSRELMNGARVSAGIAVGLVNLLSPAKSSSSNMDADASVTVPLLRGSGVHIITEPLTLAERRVVYALWNFEQYRKEFAVRIANSYFGVLRQYDRVKNSEDNYRSAVSSASRSRRLADAGRLTEIEVDQAVQRELQARNSWIAAVEGAKGQLDVFKVALGLPPDAKIELDSEVLDKLQIYKDQFVLVQSDQNVPVDPNAPPSPPGYDDARPLEMPFEQTIDMAFESRTDLFSLQGEVLDAQRDVVVKADRLRGEMTLLGSASYSGDNDDPMKFDRGRYSALLTVDLPLERMSERNAFRKSYIALEEAVRSVQDSEDRIKLSLRNDLRDLLLSREQIKILAKSVAVADKRVRSTMMFLDAGRAQMRDLLEAQDSLLSAQNDLTAAIVSYRIAELNIQRDMGVLQIDETGLWKEFTPKGIQDVN